MKTLVLAFMTGVLLASPFAVAREGRAGFGAMLQAQGQPTKKDPGQSRRADPRKDQDKRHYGRLTEEERRALHRDLNRANRELYRR